jgi:hypothetical protein
MDKEPADKFLSLARPDRRAEWGSGDVTIWAGEVLLGSPRGINETCSRNCHSVRRVDGNGSHAAFLTFAR